MNIQNGYKLVPVEPTDDMIVSFAEAWYSKRQTIDDPDMADAYRDMLAAAPTPPQPIYDEAKERELLEAYCAKVGLPTDTLPSGEYLIPATRFISQGWHARAKAGEDE